MGERIYIRRKQEGLSLQGLADLVGCTKAHIWDLEKGRTANPTLKTLVGLYHALGLGLDEMAGLTP